MNFKKKNKLKKNKWYNKNLGCYTKQLSKYKT